MAENGAMVLKSFELSDVQVVFPERIDRDPDLPREAGMSLSAAMTKAPFRK